METVLMLSITYKSMTLVIFIMVMIVLFIIILDICFDIRKVITRKRRFSKKTRVKKYY